MSGEAIVLSPSSATNSTSAKQVDNTVAGATATAAATSSCLPPTNDNSNPQQGSSIASTQPSEPTKDSNHKKGNDKSQNVASVVNKEGEKHQGALVVESNNSSNNSNSINSSVNGHVNGNGVGGVVVGTKIPSTKKDSRKLFVGGLPANITEDQFRTFFEQFGELLDSVVMFDRETGRSRGFGFVTYKDEEVAKSMLTMGDHSDGIGRLNMDGKICEVKSAQPKESGHSNSGNKAGGGGNGGGGNSRGHHHRQSNSARGMFPPPHHHHLPHHPYAAAPGYMNHMGDFMGVPPTHEYVAPPQPPHMMAAGVGAAALPPSLPAGPAYQGYPPAAPAAMMGFVPPVYYGGPVPAAPAPSIGMPMMHPAEVPTPYLIGQPVMPPPHHHAPPPVVPMAPPPPGTMNNPAMQVVPPAPHATLGPPSVHLPQHPPVGGVPAEGFNMHQHAVYMNGAPPPARGPPQSSPSVMHPAAPGLPHKEEETPQNQ